MSGYRDSSDSDQPDEHEQLQDAARFAKSQRGDSKWLKHVTRHTRTHNRHIWRHILQDLLADRQSAGHLANVVHEVAKQYRHNTANGRPAIHSEPTLWFHRCNLLQSARMLHGFAQGRLDGINGSSNGPLAMLLTLADPTGEKRRERVKHGDEMLEKLRTSWVERGAYVFPPIRSDAEAEELLHSRWPRLLALSGQVPMRAAATCVMEEQENMDPQGPFPRQSLVGLAKDTDETLNRLRDSLPEYER